LALNCDDKVEHRTSPPGSSHGKKASDVIASDSTSAPINRIQKKFSIFWFSLQALGQYALLLIAFRFLLPDVWARQIAAGPLAFVLVFLGIHLLLSFFEWGFHRYVLHSVTARWLLVFARAHRNHHGLTPIRLQPVASGSDRYVLNRYPIVEEPQHVDSAFPIYALVAFWALFTPALIGAQLLLPHLPVLLAGFSAITWSMCLYEILHAIEHLPYDWWKRATEHPRLGGISRKLYGFHHMHHANVSCNEAISGFFGLPIPDWVFGTYHQPKELLLEGRLATAKDFAIPAPPSWVRQLDSWARKREAEIHHREA
jgi:hemolysin III